MEAHNRQLLGWHRLELFNLLIILHCQLNFYFLLKLLLIEIPISIDVLDLFIDVNIIPSTHFSHMLPKKLSFLSDLYT